MNIVLVDLSPVSMEETLLANHDDSCSNTSKNNILFLDEIHDDEVILFAHPIFVPLFTTVSHQYSDPYLERLTKPPQA